MNSTCLDSQSVLSAVNDAVKGMTEIQRSTLTLHYHLSMQAIVMDNLAWPWALVQKPVQKHNGD